MLNPGDRFGDYRVLRLLGKGGMGSVFLLENAEGVQIAAKILDPATASDHEARKRFLREAQLALGVKHPNLVETYDVGEDPETGLCYILMEYVPGGDLAGRIEQKGALPISEATRIAYEIASVLELARQKGIVHRDIKPANIMFGADGKAKLADLGIARSGFGGAGMTTVTQTGMMIGTPAYMAPEQMLDAHHVDTRADIYSLGVVFFEMLTGERPNKDDTVIQLMAKAVKGEPLPDVRTLRPEVSASVAELVSLMCAMKAEERISTPVEVTTAISQIVHGREVTIRRKAPKVVEKAAPPRPPGDRARLFATCVFAVVALVGIGAFVYLGAPRHVPSKTDLVATVPVVQTSVVERVVERPVVKTVVRTSVVERVDTRTRVVTQALTKADKMQSLRRTDDTEGWVVPANPVIANIPGLPDNAGSVKVVGLAVAGELDANALRQLRFTDVSAPTSIPYGKRVLLKIEYDLPADGSIYISVSWRCARPEPAQTFSGSKVRLFSGSSYCRGRGTFYWSIELLDAGKNSSVREISVCLQNYRPMSPKEGRLASARHPIPVNLEFKARDDGWTSVRDVKSDADVESVLNEHVKKSFTIYKCDLDQALEVLKRCADDRIAFECDGTVDKNTTVDYGSNMTTVDGRRMTFRQVVADVCKMVNCQFRVADRKVVLFRELGRDVVRYAGQTDAVPEAVAAGSIAVEASPELAKEKAKLEEMLGKIVPALNALMGGTLKTSVGGKPRKIVLSDRKGWGSVSRDGGMLTMWASMGGFPKQTTAVGECVAVFLSGLGRKGSEHTEVCANAMDWYLSFRLREMLGGRFDGSEKFKGDLSKVGSGARKLDPEMSLYDLRGESQNRKAKKLTGSEKSRFAQEKCFWVFAELRKRNGDVIGDYLKAWEREQAAGNLADPVSQDDVAALFSVAVGEDLFDWFTAHGMPSSPDRTRVKAKFTGASTPAGWLDDLELAKKRAKASGRMILAAFEGSDWCGWCKKMEKDVYTQPDFMPRVTPRFVPVYIDKPRDRELLSEKCRERNPELHGEYSVRGVPCVVILDAEGKEVGRVGGYKQNVDALMERVDAIVGRAQEPSANVCPDEKHKRKADGKTSTPTGMTDDFEAACEQAKKEKKRMLLVFSGSDWCGFCKRLDDDVLSEKKFIRQVSRKYVPVYVDSPRDRSLLSARAQDRNPGLIDRYSPNGYPTVVVTDADGEELARFSGYGGGGSSAFMRRLEDSVKDAERERKRRK